MKHKQIKLSANEHSAVYFGIDIKQINPQVLGGTVLNLAQKLIVVVKDLLLP